MKTSNSVIPLVFRIFLSTVIFIETIITDIAANEITITAKSTLYNLYVDGIKQSLNNGNTWNEIDIIPLDQYNRLIGVTAIDMTATCPGILASVTDDFFVTDFTWKCSGNASPLWYSLGFDDSQWSDAYMIGPNSNVVAPEKCTILTEISAISSNAYWIWTTTLPDNYDQLISCRGYLPTCEQSSPCQNGGTCHKNSVIFCSCLPLYTGFYCEEVMTIERNLTVTAKLVLYELYIDGIQQSLNNGNTWNEVDVIPLELSNRLIAISALDLSSTCAGILASVTDDSLLTDATWKCDASSLPFWYTLGFNDSQWSDAFIIGQNDNVVSPESCSILTGIPAISSNANWIWTSSIQNAPIYDPIITCRAYIPLCDRVSLCQNGGTCNKNAVAFCNCLPGFTGFYCEQNVAVGTLWLTAKTTLLNLYIDGERKTLNCGGNSTCADEIPIEVSNRLIGVMAGDISEMCAGILASITNNYLLTDAQWKCHPGPPPQWYLLGFDDSSWSNAYVIGPNNDVTFPDACRILPGNPSISQDANWIWTHSILDTPNYDQVIYCRAYTPFCERNSPCENGGTCNSNSITMCICPPEYTGVFCEIAANRTLTIAVKTYLWDLYVDGIKKNASTSNLCYDDWTVPVEVQLPRYSRLIAVHAMDYTELCAGILASVTGDFLLTDATWNCFYGAPPLWYKLGFNDATWENAYVIGPNDDVTYLEECKILTGISSISLNANWIWYPDIVNTPAYSQAVYCRAYLPICEQESPCQNGGTCNKNSVEMCTCLVGYIGPYCETVEEVLVTLTAQEVLYAAYVDGVQIDLRHGVIAAETDHVMVWSNSRLIAVMAIQLDPDCPGILVSVKNDTLEYVLTSAAWKCSSTANVGWYNLGFNDSNWANATLIQQNIDSSETAACPNLPIVSDISENAYWIWSGPSAGHSSEALCRGYIPTCARNPCKNGVCNVNSANMCTCELGYQGNHCDQLIPTTTARSFERDDESGRRRIPRKKYLINE